MTSAHCAASGMTRYERVTLQPGYVLQHYPYRNTSLICETYTRDFGRVGLVARGARAPRSRMQGLLQPFQPLLLSWSGRGELATLTTAELAASPRHLASEALFCGYYVNELLLRLLPRHAAHTALFPVYEATLEALQQAARSSVGRERALRLFEKRLLQEAGYGLLLDREAGGDRPVEPDRRYRYQLEKGPLPEESSAAGIDVQGRTLLGLARDALVDTVSLSEAKQLMRAALALYLGDKPLKSREFFRKAQAYHRSD
jgi:DNA repair protein RecO (recombination protein O)